MFTIWPQTAFNCKRLSAPPFVMEQISSFSLFLTRMNGENIEALARAY